MARVNHTAQAVAAAGYPPSTGLVANSADISMTAADATNFEQVDHNEKLIIIARNTGVGSRTITIESIADSFGRTGDIAAYNLDAGDYAIFGPFPQNGWRQANGKLYLKASHAEVLIGYVIVP